MNNMPIGYKKSEILMVAKDIQDEIKKKEMKEKRKNGQRKFLW